MTLLDAPKYDEERARRNQVLLYGTGGLILVLIVIFWLVAGHPADWPWNWWTHLRGRHAINSFMGAVEKNDLQKAYVIWIHDKDWQQQQAQFTAHPFDQFQKDQEQSHPNIDEKAVNKAYGELVHDPDWQRHREMIAGYPFSRFEQDWGPNSSQNEYGVIQSHQIVAARVFKNVLLVGLLINGRKSKALFLTYYPKDHTLDFAPPDEELYLGP